MANVPVSLIDLTTQIVAAHVSHNTVSPDQLPDLIKQVHDTLSKVSRPPIMLDLVPAVPIKSSVKPDTIACLDCGQSFKMLKRHLMSDHQMTPAQYRERWGLSYDYPLVAAVYAKTRSRLAKEAGLGTQRRIPARKRKAG